MKRVLLLAVVAAAIVPMTAHAAPPDCSYYYSAGDVYFETDPPAVGMSRWPTAGVNCN